VKVRRRYGEGGPEKVLHPLLNLVGNDGWDHDFNILMMCFARVSLISRCRGTGWDTFVAGL
jgi:hypothetical protein